MGGVLKITSIPLWDHFGSDPLWILQEFLSLFTEIDGNAFLSEKGKSLERSCGFWNIDGCGSRFCIEYF